MKTETMNKKTITLKVAGKTNPGSLKTSICGHLKSSNRIVNLVCIGVAANYIATKALIMSRGEMFAKGRKLRYDCYFMNVVVDNDNYNVLSTEAERQKTAIRWEIYID